MVNFKRSGSNLLTWAAVAQLVERRPRSGLGKPVVAGSNPAGGSSLRGFRLVVVSFPLLKSGYYKSIFRVLEVVSVRFVHLLSKSARRRIIEIMLNGRSLRELSSVIGVTPAAISKYRLGVTHPSDEVIERILTSASERDLKEIAKVAFDDLYRGFENLLEWMVERNLVDVGMVDRLRDLMLRLEASFNVRRVRMVIK